MKKNLTLLVTDNYIVHNNMKSRFFALCFRGCLYTTCLKNLMCLFDLFSDV